MDIVNETRLLYKKYGQSKPMNFEKELCYFLQRNFKGEQDLLIIFQTSPCYSHCKFCNLSNRVKCNGIGITNQFYYVINQLKHSLSVLDRITLSNNGSILDSRTVPFSELLNIIKSISLIRNISTIVLETDLRYINITLLKELQSYAGDMKINILTGFETLDEEILLNVLGKNRKKSDFEQKLDIIAECNCDFTAYILYKPTQDMNDNEAYIEAKQSALYLINECEKRKVQLTLRINPMFAAVGTEWAQKALDSSVYSPPHISEIFKLALELNDKVPTYIGLSTENKDEKWGSYRIHSDVTQELLIEMINFNHGKN